MVSHHCWGINIKAHQATPAELCLSIAEAVIWRTARRQDEQATAEQPERRQTAAYVAKAKQADTKQAQAKQQCL